jgi:hypothetical protein
LQKTTRITAQLGGTTSAKRRPRGRKQFSFEKKNQKTSTNQGSLNPERPQPKQSKIFCFFFSKKKSFLLRASRATDLGSYEPGDVATFG